MNHFVAKGLLFDQLTEASSVGRAHSHANVSLLLTREELIQSIHRELEDIFNTRTSYTSTHLKQLMNETADESLLAGIEGLMGLPSYPNLFAEGGREWKDFQDQCELMIRLYEPRLAEPSVQVLDFDAANQRMHLAITATLVAKDRREKVSFDLAVEGTASAAHEDSPNALKK